MAIVFIVVFVALSLAVLLGTDGLTSRQRRGITCGLALVLIGIAGGWQGFFESATGGYVVAACFIPAGAVVVYLSWLGVVPRMPDPPEDDLNKSK